MKVEEGKIEGDITVDEEFVLHGSVTGNITVIKGGTLELHGICEGNLIMEKETTVNLHGTVEGDVYNQGGKLEVHGTINGTINEEE